MCKSLNDFTPEYLSSLFDYRESLDDFRESEMKLAMPRPRTNYMKTSFIYIATKSLELLSIVPAISLNSIIIQKGDSLASLSTWLTANM